MIKGVLVASWKFEPNNNRWVGIVCNQIAEVSQLTVLVVGIEYSERDIAAWCNATIELMRQQDRLDVQVPDAIERAAGTNMVPPSVH